MPCYNNSRHPVGLQCEIRSSCLSSSGTNDTFNCELVSDVIDNAPLLLATTSKCFDSNTKSQVTLSVKVTGFNLSHRNSQTDKVIVFYSPCETKTSGPEFEFVVRGFIQVYILI